MTASRAPADLRQLTSFRMVAAAWVLAFDYWPQVVGAPEPGLVAKGYLGVETFFVLSGFILSHVYGEAFGPGLGRGAGGYGAFLWARIARIYPTHLFTLVAMAAMAVVAQRLGAGGGHVADWRALPANLTLTQAWGLAPSAAFNHPSWSISAEWAAYLAFPLFAAAAWRLRARPWTAVAGALALVAGAYAAFQALAGFPLTQATIAWGALRIVPPFAYGCALRLAFRAGVVERRREAELLALLFGALVCASAALGAPDAVTVAAAGGVVLALAEAARLGSRRLASRPAVYLGEISFCLYMIAIPWREGLAGLLTHVVALPDDRVWPPVMAAILVAGAVVAAAVTHQLVERPSRLFLRRFGSRGRFRPLEECGSEQSAACDERPRETA